MTDAADDRHRDGLALLLLGVIGLGLAVWSVWATLTLTDVGGVVLLPIVPHLMIGGIGAFLVLRTGARRLGWLLAGSVVFVSSWGGAATFEATGAGWAGVVEATGGAWLTLLLLAIVLYPTGRPASRPLAVIAGAVVVLSGCTAVHWLGVNLSWWDRLGDPLELAVGLSTLPLFASFFEQARIYRRRPLEQQKQVKWYVLGLLAVPAYVVPLALGWSQEAFAVVDALTTLLFPIAILVGVTRYRLYEVDRVVSRTLAYALVLGMLGLLFVGSVSTVASLLPTQDRLAVALTTVAVVALFDPLRRRIVDLVDRRFDRTRYVARQVVAGFGRDIRDVTDVEEIGRHVHAVVSRTVAPATVAVWQPPSGASS